jgi:anti-sigma-K factor RskA
MNPDVHTLAGAYALGAVDDLERAAFRRHLDDCAACAQEVAELAATAARLADLAETAPPPGLRTAVMARIGNTRQLGPVPARGTARTRGTDPARRSRRAVGAAVAAVALAVVAAGVGTYTVEEHRVRAARAQAAQADRIAAVLGAPDAQVRTAAATVGGRVTVVVSAALGQGVALVSGLPDPSAGRSYQLWVVHGAAAVNTGAVLTAGTGRELFTGVAGADAFAVSSEAGRAVVTVPGDKVSVVGLT